MRRLALISAVTCVAALAPASAQAATSYSPLDRPGPSLDVPKSKLDAAMKCTANVSHASREPVLLSPATGVTADQNYSWNYERAFNARGIPWCQVTMPQRTLGDIQVAAEYLVHAIRTMRARAGRRIAVMGHSQGGMSMRWALRFWPDTRAAVEDVVGWAGSNHGTTVNSGGCDNGCVPASWQQGAKANFIRALNSRAETRPGISYTEIYTHTDEVVQPNKDDSGSSSVHGGGGRITNVATQDICPGDTYEHLNVGTVDPVAYALAIDALEHDGPAQESRIPVTVCLQTYQPGVDPANARMYQQILAGAPGLAAVGSPFNTVGVPTPKSEPPLRCYVFTACPAGFGQSTCLNLRGRVAGRHVGPLLLGRRRARVRAAFGRPGRTRRRVDRWCVQGGGVLEAGYRRDLRAVAALTSSRRFSVHRIRRGTSARTARRRLRHERRIRTGRNVWLLARSRRATVVVLTRRGRVRAVGLLARSAVRSRGRARRLLRSI